ncbi:hypothetical protein [Sorangium cellulosum]|uniref:hypothetical protein n=1 Tax=Sorangium sp. So ce1024 TaxID=3133327 RepID=UPI0013EA0615
MLRLIAAGGVTQLPPVWRQRAGTVDCIHGVRHPSPLTNKHGELDEAISRRKVCF